jgi:prepilin-type N-terminal cleavage/methylation domain-containing protein
MIRRRINRRGFTLIEVLVTLLFMAITLPAIMGGIASATKLASSAKHRDEATGLGETELNQILASGSWEAGNASGDFSAFSADWPDYTWALTVNPWAADTTGLGIQELDLAVNWKDAGGRAQSITLSTLAYDRAAESTTTTP